MDQKGLGGVDKAIAREGHRSGLLAAQTPVSVPPCDLSHALTPAACEPHNERRHSCLGSCRPNVAGIRL